MSFSRSSEIENIFISDIEFYKLEARKKLCGEAQLPQQKFL